MVYLLYNIIIVNALTTYNLLYTIENFQNAKSKIKKVYTYNNNSLIVVFIVVVDLMLKQGLSFMAYTSALDGFFRIDCIAS